MSRPKLRITTLCSGLIAEQRLRQRAVIGTVLDQQAELHGSGWSTSEVLGALAEASAFFCREITDLHGAAAETSAGGLAEQLHALVLGKIGVRQHGPASAESRAPEGATIH